MKASLDTNVIIHFYKADLQEILFDMFDEGVCIYEQIRSVELEFQELAGTIYPQIFYLSL